MVKTYEWHNKSFTWWFNQKKTSRAALKIDACVTAKYKIILWWPNPTLFRHFFSSASVQFNLSETKVDYRHQNVNVRFAERLMASHCVKSIQMQSSFWSAFSCIRTKYGDIRSIPAYSVRMQENMAQKKLYLWTLFTQCLLPYKGRIPRLRISEY